MKLILNSIEYEVNDAYSLIELINSSPQDLYQEIIIKLLESTHFNSLIQDNDQLIALLRSPLTDNEISKIMSFITTNKQEFKRLIPTTYEFKQTLLTINTEDAEILIQSILEDENEFDRLIKDEYRLNIWIDFLDEEFPNYIEDFFEKILNFNIEKFNKLIGDKENIIEFSERYPHLRDKLINKAFSCDTTTTEGLVKFAETVKNYKLPKNSVKNKILQSIPNKLLDNFFNRKDDISFIEFLKITKDLLTDKLTNNFFQLFITSDNELLRLRIHDLEGLITILAALPVDLAAQLFNRILNDNKLFTYFIKDNETLSRLWFGSVMQQGTVDKALIPGWAREYMFDNNSSLYKQLEFDIELKYKRDEGLSPEYLFTLQTKLHHKSKIRVGNTIYQVLSTERGIFIDSIHNKDQKKLLNILENALTNSALLERLFKSTKYNGEPFSLKDLFELIPNDLAYKLIQAIIKNDRLDQAVDLMSISQLSSVKSLNSLLNQNNKTDFNEIENEITNKIKNNTINYSSLNLFLHLLNEKNKKILDTSPIKANLENLIDFVKKSRVPSLRRITSFFLQQSEVTIKSKTHDEIAEKKEIIQQALSKNMSLKYEEIVTDINNNNNTLNAEQIEKKNKLALEKMLQRAKTDPDLLISMFKQPRYVSQFNGAELCALALSNVKVANGLLEQLSDKFETREISFQDIKTIIKAFPEITSSLLQRLQLGSLHLLIIADIHPEAANAILKTPKQLSILAKRPGVSSAIVILAKKHLETAKFVLNQPLLSNSLTDDNVVEIATNNPDIVDDILRNEKIMNKMSEEAQELLGTVYSLQQPASLKIS
ncbi:hypothetical protein [Legionella gresilensis]|uniref:hypothetical protein n=1 Tax=Legionella gresilensis TaxID=91823 RepID=UPI001041781B|nr:hypothetical protein [Legionella gresilensis]